MENSRFKPFEFIGEISCASFWIKTGNVKSCLHFFVQRNLFLLARKEIGGSLISVFLLKVIKFCCDIEGNQKPKAAAAFCCFSTNQFRYHVKNIFELNPL